MTGIAQSAIAVKDQPGGTSDSSMPQTYSAPLPPDIRGLDSGEAAQRLAVSGPNEPSRHRKKGIASQVLLLFANPLVAILLIASAISATLGERTNAAIIIIIVLLSAALNFAQAFRSQRAVERLRAGIAPRALTLRDEAWEEIPRSDLVPGDMIRLSAGDLVPADALLVETQELHVQEAALTGESAPTAKEPMSADKLPQFLESLGAPDGWQHLQPVSPMSPEAAYHVYMGSAVATGSAVALVMLTGPRTVFGEIASRLTSRPPETEFERGMRRLSLMITRVIFFLVLFVFAVSAVFRHNPLESLLFAVALAVGLTPEFLPMITAVTLGQGAVKMARKKVIVKRLPAIENLGSIDILCSDKTGTLTSDTMALEDHFDAGGERSDRVFELAYLNSYFEKGVRSTLDTAVLQHRSINCGDYRQVGEIPFDFERRRLSVIVEHGAERMLITKGAPENVLEVCSSRETAGQPLPLNPAAAAAFKKRCEECGEQGLRALAVAYRKLAPGEDFRATGERDLALSGVLTFSNPLLPDAAQAIQELKQDGVSIKILTGDSEPVARHVCSQVGLDTGRIVLGDEIDGMTGAALAHVAEHTTVFARVAPAQKSRILTALKSRGHVVGFLGDGINDAPSLHAADVGISVANGVDVAKDAADIILMESSLRVLHSGIIEGRKAFGNVLKYLLMGVSSNFGNMFSMAGASVFLPFLPMLPTQILLNNFLYDLSQVSIPSDTVDPAILRRPQRWDIQLIQKFMIVVGPISSVYDFLTFFVLLHVFHASEALFHTGWFVESLATQTLVIFVIRTAGSSLSSRPSGYLTASMAIVVLVGAALPYLPVAAAIGFTPLPAAYFLFLIIMIVTYMLLVEFVKRRLLRRFVLAG